MKPTEVRPIDNIVISGAPRPDRLTPLLILAAVLLVIILALLVSDLWLRPISGGHVAQAVGPAQSVPTSLPPTTTPSAPVGGNESSPAPITPPACVPPGDWGIYPVQPGNTLYSLAQRYNTDVDTLMHVNCLNTTTIFVGQQLYVPGPPPSSQAASTELSDQPSPPADAPQPGASATPVAGAAVAVMPTLTPMPAFPINIPDRYTNIVLLGSDRRPGAAAWRTDSMIIVSVDATNNMVRLLSIPRDLWVYIPGHGYNRINTADLWGELAKKGSGPERIKKTIHHNLGIPIHYYVRVDFEGFVKIIDAVGGIDVDVDCPLPDMKLSAGMDHMDGRRALRYARSRYSTNDFDRSRRQRKVLMALWDQALTLNIIPRLPELWWTMTNSFQTDLSLDQVITLAYVGAQLEPQDILSRAINASHVQGWMTPQGASVLLPRQDRIRALLENYYTPVDPRKLAGADTALRVLNGSQRRDADQLAVANLKWAGYKAKAAGVADHQNYSQTQILVYSGNVDIAREIARDLRVPAANIQDLTGTAEQPDPAKPVDFQVILGRDYDPCQR